MKFQMLAFPIIILLSTHITAKTETITAEFSSESTLGDTNTSKKPHTTITTTSSPPLPSTTSSPKPCPSINPQVATYNVTKKNSSEYCIIGKFAASFVSLNGSFCQFALENATVDQDQSQCNNKSQVMVLLFSKNKLTLHFSMINDTKSVSELHLQLVLQNQTMKFTNTNNNFPVSRNESYFCKSDMKVNATSDHSSLDVIFSHLQLDSFRSGNSTDFNTPFVCKADSEISDIIPIVVGIALLALLAIVFIAYIIFRKRDERSTYQSV